MACGVSWASGHQYSNSVPVGSSYKIVLKAVLFSQYRRKVQPMLAKMRLQSLLLAATAFSASCLAQLDLTSCESTNYTCMEARIRADQALVELPNFVTYPIQSDHFYDTPANISGAQAGQILKLEMYTNSTPYSIPPGQSLSRIMYASLDNFGAIVPATAAILWPFSPKSFNGSQSYPLVAWAHGTSGIDRQCAVSNLRNLQVSC